MPLSSGKNRNYAPAHFEIFNQIYTIKYAAFSIIIPTFNRAVQLRNCLSAIAALDFPAYNFEVIVVDDGSKQSLPDAVVNKFSKSLKIS
ncbi:MAG: glycosyltransferase [Calditrichia bacterium]